ncbi:MAG: outer membrane beta-barrel protein [Chlorobium sp.]
MRNNILKYGVILASGLFMLPVSSHAKNEPPAKTISYVGIHLGSGIFNAGLGLNYREKKFDVEIGHDSLGDNSTTSYSESYLLLNYNYDLNLHESSGTFKNISPYLTAGLGLAMATDKWVTSGKPYSVDYSTIAYQIGAGFTIPLRDNITADARLRYIRLNYPTFPFEIGVRVAL